MEKYVIILLCKVGDLMSDFNSKEFGKAIALALKEDNVQGVILTST